MSVPPTPASPSPPTAAAAAPATPRLWLAVTIVLVALKAFALGASGSVSVLASLTESLLDLIAGLIAVLALRWSSGGGQADRTGAMATLVQSGLVFASAAFVGGEALMRMFAPRPVVGGPWAVAAVVASLVVVAAYLWWSARRRGGEAAGTGRAVWLADLGSGGVALIGLVSGALLAAPGLDAAAGLVLAVWLFWGGVASLRPAARILTATS